MAKMKWFLRPYKKGSKSAKALAQALGLKRVAPDYEPSKDGKGYINWGSTNFPAVQSFGNAVNKGTFCCAAANKRTFFAWVFNSVFNELVVPNTESLEVAKQWVTEGAEVVCRTKLTGHSGDGIVLAANQEDLVHAPLYTKYIKKRKEFRVHCFANGNYHVAEKRKRIEFDGEVNTKIRNHQNGWVFCTENVDLPQEVAQKMCEVVKFLGLDFGACDVIWNEHHNRYYLLEINTAPGLEGCTLDFYATNLKALMESYA